MGSLFFKKALPHIAAILTFLLVNIAYFNAQMSGKVVQQGDIVSYHGMAEESKAYTRLSGETSLWTNAMFGGMPTYTIQASAGGNKIGLLEKIEQLGLARPIGYFNALMIGFYLLMVVLGVNPWLAIAGAVGFGLSTNNLVLFEAGHTSKLRAIYHIAPVILGTLLTFRKQYILGGILFAVGMALNLFSHHPQMTYYLAMCLGIYVLIEAVNFVKKGEVAELMKIAGVLGIGLFLGVLSSSSYLWTTYDYGKDTMRGKPILTKTSTTNSSSSSVDGLDWQYAMQWSNGGKDLIAMLIPGAVGGSSREKIAPTSAIAQDMRKKGAQVPAASLYWGSLPFTSGPGYLGAIFCFLFLFGAFTVRGSVKWWLIAATILTILISLGKNLEVFNRLLFDYLPMYNKFRAPSSILSVTALLVPMLGILGLSNVFQNKVTKKDALKALYIAGGVTAGISLLFALIGPALFDFKGAVDGRLQQGGFNLDAVVADRKSLLRGDGFRSFALIALSAGLIWAYLTDKIKQNIVIAGLGVLMLFDMWGVGKRYLDEDSFVTNSQYSNNYTPRAVDQQIFQAEGINYSSQAEGITYNNPSLENIRKRGNYRVLDMSINTFESSQTSYFHNTIGGYSAAKLQRIQDMIDQHLTKGNQAVFDMLNTKYFISQQQQLQRNPGALGNAWFVEEVQKVATPNEEIAALTNFVPANKAVVLDSEFDNYVGNFDPTKNGTITMTDYKPNYLSYTSNATSEQLAVFSEIWYGPDKGWKAFVDGQPVDHIRANYILRAMKVPAGQHKIEFMFEPDAYYTGVTISTISSLLILLGFIGFVGFRGYQYFEEMKNFKPAKTVKKVAKVVPTKAKNKRKKR